MDRDRVDTVVASDLNFSKEIVLVGNVAQMTKSRQVRAAVRTVSNKESS